MALLASRIYFLHGIENRQIVVGMTPYGFTYKPIVMISKTINDKTWFSILNWLNLKNDIESVISKELLYSNELHRVLSSATINNILNKLKLKIRNGRFILLEEEDPRMSTTISREDLTSLIASMQYINPYMHQLEWTAGALMGHINNLAQILIRDFKRKPELIRQSKTETIIAGYIEENMVRLLKRALREVASEFEKFHFSQLILDAYRANPRVLTDRVLWLI